MISELLAVSAIVPSLLLVWYFRSRDVFPEPARVIWATFGLGILTVLPVLIVALPVAYALQGLDDPYLRGFLSAWLTAGIPEEFFKFVVVVLYCSRHREFDEPMDGIVYGAVASLGFATFENCLYVAQGGSGAAVMRAFTAVPAHAFMGAIMGYYVGQARFTPARRRELLLAGYLASMVVHTLYDFPLMTIAQLNATHRPLSDEQSAVVAGLALLTLLVLIFAGVWATTLVRRLRRGQTAQLAALNAYRPPNAYAPIAPPGYGPAMSYPGAAVATPPASSATGWALLVSGGLLASAGGMMVLGAVLMLVRGLPPEITDASFVTAVLAFGLFPLALGFVLFVLGVRALNRRSAARAPATR